MKTAGEIYEEIYDHFIWPEVATGTDYEAIKNVIVAFEKDIRKEQDKITRQACADNELEFRVWDVQKKFHGKLDMLMILGPDHIEVDYEGHTKEPRRVRPEEAIVEQKINGEWVPVSFKSV